MIEPHMEPFPRNVICWEGIDGCGKGTQIQLMREYLIGQRKRCEILRDPYDGPLGPAIRELSVSGVPDAVRAAMPLAFSANRIFLTHKTLELAKKFDYVLADRIWLSTLVFQGYDMPGREGERFLLDLVRKFESRMPQKLIFLDISPEQAEQRMAASGRPRDNFEQRGLKYYRILRERYYLWIERLGIPVLIVNAEKPADQVHAEIRGSLRLEGFLDDESANNEPDQ